MNILVTGAAGFIGSHIAQAFQAAGHHVTGVDCYTDYYSPALKRLNTDDLQKDNIRMIERDLASDRLDDLLVDMDGVAHSAAQPGIAAATPFDLYLRNNVIATSNLVEAARKKSTLQWFINVSTSSVYGKYATVSEDAEPRPTSYYGVTKLAGEQLAMAAFREYGFPACSLRLFSVYGPRERPEKLYFRLIASILQDRIFPLYEGSLEHSRSYTYIGDALPAFLAVARNPAPCLGEIINIGSDMEITTAQGIRVIEALIGKKARLETRPRRAGDQERTCAVIDKARRLLGYQPRTTIEEGLRRQVDWYMEKIHGKFML